MNYSNLLNYNYKLNMMEDLKDSFKDWLDYNISNYYETDPDELTDALTRAEIAQDFEDVADEVTGNRNGSYTFNEYEAKLMVMDHLDDLADALEEYGFGDSLIADMMLRKQDYERLDVILRCYYFPDVYNDFLNKIKAFDEILNEKINELKKRDGAN